MSDQLASIERLQEEVHHLLEEARENNRILAETREKAIASYLQSHQQMLAHVETISNLRQEIFGLIESLEGAPGFGEEALEELGILGDSLLNAPLFHPQYEKMLARLAAAKQNGRPVEATLREEIEEQLRDFDMLPDEDEIEAGKMILDALKKKGEASQGQDIELATRGLQPLAGLALQHGLAGSLPREEGIRLLQNMKEGLKENASRLQSENQLISNSKYGRRAQKNEPQENLEDLKNLQDMLSRLREALEDSRRLGAPSPMLDEVAEQFGPEDEEEYRQALVDAFLDDMLDESEGLMFSEDYDADDDGFFPDEEEGWEDEEDWEEVENPRYPVGSSVEVIRSETPFRGFPKLNIQGWQGRVEHVYTNGELVVYEVSLDSVSLRALPEKFIKKSCEEEYGNFFLFEFEEEGLRPAVARDTEDEAISTNRRLFHRYFWGNVDEDKQAARVFGIMMRQPAADDIDNWLAYFRDEVEFPFDAQVEGLILRQIEPGTAVEVLGIEGADEEEGFGLVASIRKGRAILSYPLMELMPVNDKDPKAQPLLDYRFWADLMI